jgi:hypothetical protein
MSNMTTQERAAGIMGAFIGDTLALGPHCLEFFPATTAKFLGLCRGLAI